MFKDHHAHMAQWSLHKYKCLWGVGDKGWGSSLQERALHIITLRLKKKKRPKKNYI